MRFSAGFGKRIPGKTWFYVLSLAVLVLLPFVVQSEYSRRILTMIFLYSILSLGLNLVTGVTGQLSLGHAAFYGIGAYTSALLTLNLNWSFLPALLVASLLAGLFGILLGVPTLRLSGDYLCIVTIGFAEIIRLVFQNWVEVTRGPMGLPGIPPISILSFTFKTGTDYYYFFLIMMVLTYISMERILDSQIGRALVAIREDEVAAGAMGVNTTYYKVLAFAVGAVFAGMAGSLMAHYLAFVGPMNFTVDESLLVLQMVILGGLGSNIGAIIGAAILVIAPEVLRVISDYRLLFNGVLMVALMVWRPQGLLGTTGGGVKFRLKYFSWLSARGTRSEDAVGEPGRTPTTIEESTGGMGDRVL